MIRVKRGNVARSRHRKILKLAKSYKGAHSRLFRIANQQVMKALRYSYKHRKEKKRMFRKIWIIRINTVAHSYGYSYNSLIHSLKKSKIELNRKMLAQIALIDMLAFKKLIKSLK